MSEREREKGRYVSTGHIELKCTGDESKPIRVKGHPGGIVKYVRADTEWAVSWCCVSVFFVVYVCVVKQDNKQRQKEAACTRCNEQL